MTQLRQIMLEELVRRNYAQSTIRNYIRTVERYSRHFHCSLDQLGLEHIREYQAAMFRIWKAGSEHGRVAAGSIALSLLSRCSSAGEDRRAFSRQSRAELH